MQSSALTILAIARETVSHITLCEAYGISKEELMNTVESPATTAYGGYLIDVAVRVGSMFFIPSIGSLYTLSRATNPS